jgi:hydrogenase maturation protease
VVGIGNPDCGDDAAGPLVAGRVAALCLPEVDVVEQADPLDLLPQLVDRDTVVVVDAVAPAGSPGRVHVRALPGSTDGKRRGGARGSHGLDVREVVELARALGRAPRRVVLVGVEGVGFEPGTPVSPAVTRAIATAAEAAVAALGCTVLGGAELSSSTSPT